MSQVKGKLSCLYVCPSHISRTIRLIFFIFGVTIAEDPWKCSVEFGTIWMCNTFNIINL